jgi:hypothetical protein
MQTPIVKRTTTPDDSNPAVAVAKTVLNKSWKAWDKEEAKAKLVGVQIFQLFANLLYDKSHQPCDKIIKAQSKTDPWEDINREKTCELFLNMTSPADGIEAHCWGHGEILHHQHPQEAQSSAFASVFQACQETQQLP